MPTQKVQCCEPGKNEEELKINLDLLEGLREEASIRIAAQQRRAARYFDAKIKPRPLKVGDWVLRHLSTTGRKKGQGKLSPTLDGPYKIVKMIRQGTYHLVDAEGNLLPHAWNSQHLKKYYQ